SFLVWASERSTGTLLPAFSPAAALVFVPVALIVPAWLATGVLGKPRPNAALVFCAGVLISLAIGALGTITAAFVNVHTRSQWSAANVHFLVFAGPFMAAMAALHHWGPKMWGRKLSEGLGFASFGLVLIGAVLAFAPGYFEPKQPLLTANFTSTNGASA